MQAIRNAILGIVAVAIFAAACASVQESSVNKPPEGLSAQEYLRQGVQSQRMGRVELSRKCLVKAIELDGNGKIGNAANKYLISKVPPVTVPEEAEQRNIIGTNQRIHKDFASAKKTFADLIRDYPKFEWPYGNMALTLMDEQSQSDDPALQSSLNEEAERWLRKALEINPNYANGWLYLSQSLARQNRTDESIECKKKSHQWD